MAFTLLLLAVTPAYAAEGLAEGIYYQSFGEGKPVLIINGGPGLDSEGFATVAKAVAAQGFQAILFDQRGTGRSPLPVIDKNTVTMDLMVADMEKIRKKLKLKQWTILGHSFGGMLAAHYASQHPEQVEKLIFSSSGGLDLDFVADIQPRINQQLSVKQRTEMAAYQLKQSLGDSSAATNEKRVNILAQAYVLDKSKAPLVAARLKVVNMQLNQLVFADMARIKFDHKQSFANFAKPVLVLQGDQDIISIHTAEKTQRSFPNARLEILKNCAHYGWLDQPEQYYRLLFVFLKA
ncbi:alpha/beta fold hydrolase [Rheinheimera sp.]|uniref:alpha/beta fold hydrolase n=1 Tax=Rheinheimera sp. TaxID=1869214 RepID=UPI0027B93100|nr:alpha/beta fold hydrolase [Rheinheimera sp.]